MTERVHRHFEDVLDELKERVLRLGGLTEQAIGRAVRCLVDRDSELARRVIEDDNAIDGLELQIDDLCVEALARYQPMAGDLRFITTAMKITSDLERIADHACNIAERALELNEEPQLKPLIDIPLMANQAQEMVRSSLDCFVRRDAEGAKATIRLDRELNQRMEQVFRELLSYMIEDPRNVSRAIRLTFVAKYFERIGDMAKNICEQVVFMAKGEVIKHMRARQRDPEDDAGR